MNLQEQLAAKLAELENAKSVEEINTIKDEIKALKEQIEIADEKQSILDSMKSETPVESGKKESPVRTMGERAAKAFKSSGATRGQRFSISSADVKADVKADVNVRPNDYMAAVTEYQPDIVKGARRQLTVADLFGSETTKAAAVTYFVETAATGSPAAIAENGKYPTITFGDPASRTDALKKIGCIYRDSDELLDDMPRLAQSIDNQADYMMDIVEEDQLLKGDGAGNNIQGLLNRSGIQTTTAASLKEAIEAIKSAKVGVKKNTPGFRADALVINDEDWDELTSVKDANEQYLAGGPFYGAYGSNNGPIEEPPLWGLRVVATQAIEKGTMVVGAFKLGATVIRNGGRVVDVSNSDGEDFSNGRVAFRPSERIALAVRYPAAFVKITVGE